jgi:glycine hydroxymethyltransferase
MIARGISKMSRAIHRSLTYQQLLKQDLSEADPEMFKLVQAESHRQRTSINLIASENYASVAALQAMGSSLNNKYSEGYPGARYYGGCEVIDEVERLTQKRALEAFNLDSSRWGVNCQALSGSPANQAIFYGIGGVGCKIMGPELMHGGVNPLFNPST